MLLLDLTWAVGLGQEHLSPQGSLAGGTPAGLLTALSV